MPFNPTLPLSNSAITSAELRSQFNGLKAEIDDRPNAGQVDAMIAGGAAALPAGVATLGMSVSNPPTQAEVQAIADKLDELLVILKRL
jgi:N-acyl-D-aspartate/D-glutamate deacylase